MIANANIGTRYTSFTGCAILLFSASQKLLELRAEEVGQDLSYASPHLNVFPCAAVTTQRRESYIPHFRLSSMISERSWCRQFIAKCGRCTLSLET